ncbi:MAG: DEAD/DEAH box helicase [Candidatus Cloacimonetes bacterium]|nr:DEAD/DEAH box helicase [Candidatus Cloacimonadota bacterium]
MNFQDIFSEEINRNIVYHRLQPSQQAVFHNVDELFEEPIERLLQTNNIHKLYIHQFEAIKEIKAGNNVVISTKVSSGKSLSYQIPILDTIRINKDSRSLLLFPTKALTQDQKKQFVKLIEFSEFAKNVSLGIYDGDTPSSQRNSIRKKANIIFTNPDMLHLGILPHHTVWNDFFSNLKYIVIDEVHIYRGIFGSHFANVIRRLKRIAAFYNSYPQFIVTSATLTNINPFIEKLIGSKFKYISNDYSFRAQKHIYFYNPPIVNKELGIRKNPVTETIKIAEKFLELDKQTLIFTQSRKSVEMILRFLQSKYPEKNIIGYRSGYLSSKRRDIENDIKNGKIRIIVATNALELGIDLGGLDAVILNGYPGSLASTTQQIGRAGRRGKTSHAVLVASSNLIDQYLIKNPQYLFSNEPEEALIDPDNPFILLQHIKCALFEKPFLDSETFGELPDEEFNAYLNFLQKYGVIIKSGDKFFWKANKYPANEISLRSSVSGNYILMNKEETIGIMDENSTFWMTHPHAVYLHLGESFLVKKLDLENRIVELEKKELDYYTQAIMQTEIELIKSEKNQKQNLIKKEFGQIKVIEQVKGFKKIKWNTNEILSYEDLELPKKEMITKGFWFTINEKIIDELIEKNYLFEKNQNYGNNWKKTAKQAKERDQYCCQICGKRENEKMFHVHHINPLKNYTDLHKANKLENLITLCPSCHKHAEKNLYIQNCFAGFAYLLGHIAPFFIMCDRADIRVNSNISGNIARGKQGVIFYDAIPGGIGLSEKLYCIQQVLFREALKIIEDCECSEGCPACTGPVAENGKGAKELVRELLKKLKN